MAMAVAQSFRSCTAGGASLVMSSSTAANICISTPECHLQVLRRGFSERNALSSSSSSYGEHGGSCYIPRRRSQRQQQQCRAKSYKVEMVHEGVTHVLDVPEDETILSVALDENVIVPHDCKLGVCMTCPARLVKGEVDQSGGMLSDDVIEKGYALMCVSYPLSDCRINTIPEEELLNLQLATSDL